MRESVTLYVVKGGYWLQHLHVDPPRAPMNDEQSEGVLLYPAPPESGGGISVVSGTFDGPITVTIETGEDAADRDPAEWELVDGADLVAQGVDLVVSTLDDVYEDLGQFTLAPGDHYHVRQYARGVQAARDAHALEPDATPIEHHLLQVWKP